MKKQMLKTAGAAVLTACLLLGGCGSDHKEVEKPSAGSSTETAAVSEAMEENPTRETEQTAASATETSAEAQTQDNTSAGAPVDFLLDTVDINGNQVSNDLIADAKVVMFNFWEPWCGPCVGEMPDLQKLYEDYKEEGLLVVGLYTTFEQDEEALAIAADKGITYPILKATAEMVKFQTGYVPTSFFADSKGMLLNNNAYVGAHSYEEWESVIVPLLEEQQ